MSYGLTAPAAMAALILTLKTTPALKGTALDGSDVAVRDGNELTDTDAHEAIAVGWTGGEDDAAADGALTAEGYGGIPDREEYSIHCALAVMTGDNDIPSCRARAFVLLGTVGQMLAADQKLGGAVLTAKLGTWSLREAATDFGTEIRILFDVDCDAFTNR